MKTILLHYYHHFRADKYNMTHIDKANRYQRQTSISGFGEAAQQKLARAKVLVAGAGGLGCPALLYLAAAGVGCIGIAEDDVVELSNLQRQTLYNIYDIGKPKLSCAIAHLSAFNPDIKYIAHSIRLDSSNALDIIEQYDLVIDGTDNFATRYMLNDACVLLDKPLVYGAVLRYEAQVAVFNLKDPKTGIKTNYRDAFPHPPDIAAVTSCNEAGVLGVVPGIAGSMQAAEAIKIITGTGVPRCNKILSFNVLNNRYYEIEISPIKEKHSQMPDTSEKFRAWDYAWHCADKLSEYEIPIARFDIMRANEDLFIIDVREPYEQPTVEGFPYTNIPLAQFEDRLEEIPEGKPIVLFCKSGKRSMLAWQILQKNKTSVQAYSLKGGIDNWVQIHILQNK